MPPKTPRNFLKGKQSIEVRVTRASGSAVYVRRKNLPVLPSAPRQVKLLLPDKSTIQGKYTPNPINPFIGGAKVPEWIRSVVSSKGSVNASLTEVAPGVLQIRLPASSKPSNKQVRQQAAKLNSQIGRFKPKGRRRKVQKVIEVWERRPQVRDAVLDQWPTVCQVDGCDMLGKIPAELHESLLEVHHVAHVSRGGTDAANNLTLLCRNHHKLVHLNGTSVSSETERKVVLDVPIAGKIVVTRPPLAF